MSIRNAAPGPWIAALGATALGVYAFLIEPRWLQLTRTRIRIHGLPPGLDGLRVALLTDFHFGRGTPMSLVQRAREMAMREAPDLIALTGDFAADSAHGFQQVLNALARLHAPLGVYAVPGNHDYEVGIHAWHRETGHQPEITDLTNRALILEAGGARLCVAGVDDFSRGVPRLDELPPPGGRDLTILLAHDPDQAERARDAYDQVDLVLSGHTHGGQVRLPWIGALRNPAIRGDLYEAGLRQRPWTQVYTSRGIGTSHLPVRFLCRPEVAILEIRA